MAKFRNNNRSIQLFAVQLKLSILRSLMQIKRFLLISCYLVRTLLIFIIFAIFIACKVSSPESSSAPLDPIPSAPTNLTARAVSLDQIDLSWNESTDDNGTPSYRIIRNYSFLQDVNGTKFSDKGLNPETQYCYRVVAYDSDGNFSAPSPDACTVSSWIISNTNIGLGDTEVSSTPSIAVDSSGRVIYSYKGGKYGNYYKYATKTEDGWIVEQLNLIGDVYSMAIDSFDNAHISYDGPGDYLSYVTNSSGGWVTEIIDNTLSVTHTSIAVDSANYIHISYTGMFNGVRTIKYATNASGNWITEILESTNTIDYRSPNPIAVDLNGDVHISFIARDSNGDSILRYITNVSGTWSTDTIDISQTYFEPYSSIAVDSAGNVNIIWYDHMTLKHATNSSGAWISENVDSPFPIYPHFSLAVDSYGNSHVSYINSIYGQESLKYAKNVSGAWESYIIDEVRVEVAPASIAIDADDKIHIIYNYRTGLRYVTNR